jgi:3-deoxy-D-manno-octulosonic-acid transferase
MLMTLYSFALAVALVLSAPWWLARMLMTDRYREGLTQRLGRVPAWVREFAQSKHIVWLHAVSVGETLAATRLVAELEDALNANAASDSDEKPWRVVISTTTRTGQHLAEQRFGTERVFYFPLDFAFAVRAYLRALQPHMLVLMESELWPRLLHECAATGVPVVVANARMSDRSFTRTQRFASLWKRMASRVTLFLVQSEQDAERLRQLGATNVTVTGNLKYDIRAPKQSRIAELIREVADGRPIVVAGSTVASTEAKVFHEEAQVTESWIRSALPMHFWLWPRVILSGLTSFGIGFTLFHPCGRRNSSAESAEKMRLPTVRQSQALSRLQMSFFSTQSVT